MQDVNLSKKTFIEDLESNNQIFLRCAGIDETGLESVGISSFNKKCQ
jgi:hypothetical protein